MLPHFYEAQDSAGSRSGEPNGNPKFVDGRLSEVEIEAVVKTEEIINMDIFLIFVIVMFLVVAISWKTWFRRQQVNTVASILTVMGVLGTFIGIYIGLQDFDTDPIKIQGSISTLLEGLKVAFLTSIAGIALSILLKVIVLLIKQTTSTLTYAGATVDDLAQLMGDILAVEREEGKETRETLRSIEKSLTGDGDSTVLTQLQKLRTAFSDKQDDLIHAFNDFAAKMTESNTNALIEALEAVMRDFNAKINEQFGDNFKQLNEAVGRMVEWQALYRQHMGELAEEFRVAAGSVEKSRESLEIIAERSDAIVSSAEKLDSILQALQHQMGELNNHLVAFSSLADNARDAFPVIKDRLDQLTSGFSMVVRETIDNSHASMQSQRDALTAQSQQLETMVENTSRHIQKQTEDIFDKITIRIEEVIDSTFQGLKDSLASQSQQLESTINSTNQGLSETMRNQSEKLETMVGDTSVQLRKLTDDFSTSVQKAIDDSHASMQSQREALNEFSNMVKESIDNSHADMVRQRDALQDFTSRIDGVIQSTTQGLENTLAETNRRLESTLQTQSRQLSTETERIFRESTSLMTQQIQVLDKALQEELTKALESLGSQLTSLSRRFVEDYSPLTEQLHAVVQMASRIPETSN